MQRIMKTKTRADAMALVKRYGLDTFDYKGVGTTQGFADDLFERGTEVNIYSLAELFHHYRRRCEEDGTAVVDARLAASAQGIQDNFIDSRTRERLALAEFIEATKGQPLGDELWAQIALLATSLDPVAVASKIPYGMRAALLKTLEGLKQFHETFEDSVHTFYSAGDDEVLDSFMAADILRFDQTLRNEPPWDVGDPDWFDEAGALLRLAADEELHAALSVQQRRVIPTRHAAHRSQLQ